MTDDFDTILATLRKASRSLNRGKISQALSHIEGIQTDCSLCEDYLEQGKELARSAIEQCAIVEDEECEQLILDFADIIDVLKEGYQLAKEEE